MPIADIKLVMMASAAVLAAQHFTREVDDWEGLPSSTCTWSVWKSAFRLAHVKCQHQILASGEGEPLGGAHGVLPTSAPAIGRLESALDNLALVVLNDTAVLQQLTAANLALTSSVEMLTATNKKLVEAVTRRGGNPAATPAVTPAATPAGGGRPPKIRQPPHPGNYCWTHGLATARNTRVQPVSTRPLANAMRLLLRTPLAAVRRTNVGMQGPPDGGGWRI